MTRGTPSSTTDQHFTDFVSVDTSQLGETTLIDPGQNTTVAIVRMSNAGSERVKLKVEQDGDVATLTPEGPDAGINFTGPIHIRSVHRLFIDVTQTGNETKQAVFSYTQRPG